MPRPIDIVEAVKQAAVEAVDAGNPMQLRFGTVKQIAPLQIAIDQKLTLGEKQLILTRNVTNHKVMMAVDHLTEPKSGGSGPAEFATHDHAYKGTKAFQILNALKVGEKVILLRMQGGQKFMVLDRWEGEP